LTKENKFRPLGGIDVMYGDILFASILTSFSSKRKIIQGREEGKENRKKRCREGGRERKEGKKERRKQAE
jgi:hypothetical protein